MELYPLDPLLRRQYVIDKFQSLIWTERYDGSGDFELEIYSTNSSRSLLKADTLLAMNKSLRVMKIESIEDEVDADGRRILSVKGRSLEAILEDRVFWNTLGEDSWEDGITKFEDFVPAEIVRTVVEYIAVAGGLSDEDIIPFLQVGSFTAEDTIPEPIDPITVEVEPSDVYTIVSTVCKNWNLGFRILREYDESKLWFDVYSGSDRTTSQTILSPVVFAPELDNLQNTKELNSIDNAKNVAYVFSPAGSEVVYGNGVDPSVEGFERKVLVVVAKDIEAGNPNASALMIQRGTEELSKHRTYQAFDGEISQNSEYIYGEHYNLGDIVEMRNVDGVTNNMRVTEQIFVEDEKGERAYPTLTLNLFINTGSWLSWLNNKEWVELTTEQWATQP